MDPRNLVFAQQHLKSAFLLQSTGLTLRERLQQRSASQDQLSVSGGQAEDSPLQGSEAAPASREHISAPNRGLNEAQDTEAADYVPSNRYVASTCAVRHRAPLHSCMTCIHTDKLCSA